MTPLPMERVYVVVHGGIVINVDSTVVDLTHTVIDFDLAETDPGGVWSALDAQDRTWVRGNYAELCDLFFGDLMRAADEADEAARRT